MDEFIKKWKSDKRYQTKVKLLLYTGFVVIVSIYALSINNSTPRNETLENREQTIIKNDNKNKQTINIPTYYKYDITIDIDNKITKYSGEKLPDKETIQKENNDSITNYIKENDEYYIEDNGIYVKTTKESIYDIINYNYLDLNNINNYLSKAKTDNNKLYKVYLKDIILSNSTNNYFTIEINDNNIDIDYTTFMQEFLNNIKSYKVNINILELE